ncbi:MAG TPA: hypothetical protein VMU22_04660 [Rhizomicrobium sp.]|nr:hypothetical protein [Rhizomicrobium sp.]
MNRKLNNWIADAESIARIVVLVAIFVGWAALLSYESHVDRASPRAPDVATGETVPVHWKSVIVYERPFDAKVHEWTGYVTLVGAVGLVALWLTRKRRKNSN